MRIGLPWNSFPSITAIASTDDLTSSNVTATTTEFHTISTDFDGGQLGVVEVRRSSKWQSNVTVAVVLEGETDLPS